MSPTNDDIVEFARIGGISLIASFAASVYDRTAFAAFFCVRGRLRPCEGLQSSAARSLMIPGLERIGGHPADHLKANDWSDAFRLWSRLNF
jgi:hypothetical protein